MKISIILFSLFYSITTFGQITKSVEKIAFDYYIEQNFDSAIVYYQRVLKTDSSSYHLGMLGSCYMKLKRFDMAKVAFNKCLLNTTVEYASPFSVPKRSCCHQLSTIYFEEENFEKALFYLKLAEQKYPHFRICSNGEFERKMELNYKFAQCFKGLNQIDSAISYLTPFMFSSVERPIAKEVQGFYLDLITQKYSKSKLKYLLTEAIENLHYDKSLDTSMNRYSSEYIWYNIDCSFEFLGSTVILYDGGYESKSWGGEPVYTFTKAYYLDYLSTTEVYQKLIKF